MRDQQARAACYFLLTVFVGWSLFRSEDGGSDSAFQSDLSFIRVRTKSIFDSFSGISAGSGGFRSGWGNVISNAISMAFPSSCVGQLINIGYLSSELDEDDYPYNPNCGAPSQSNNMCFPGNSLISTRERGEIELKDLSLGEHVLVRDFKTMELRYSKVEIMLHRDENLYISDEWIQVSYLGMRRPLVLSPNHLLFIHSLGENPQDGGCHEPDQIKSALGIEKTPPLERRMNIYSIQAKDIMVGDSIIVDSKRRVSWVTRVSLVSSQGNPSSSHQYVGRYAPLTTDSYLIVNGVLVSSYSRPFPWPLELLNPSHWLIDLLARPFISMEVRSLVAFEQARDWTRWLLQKVSSLSSKYTFDHTTALSLEIVRAISLIVK
ncbi:signal peptide and hedgehog-type HINT domain-containing protein [Cryptosporidium canis]|uniref:Signal peptide and hedgehog-type HINT domain-containing protein n=1 Tax=Cryptosporidium canis TaxID=195482 RepID=A0A9D5DIS8_9CRYT|nr:signal peptide and hedgehog-type HINT domain-containing protein [Cryptosporidium canis]